MKEKFQSWIISLGISEKVTNTVSIVFGSVLLIYGVVGLINYYTSKNKKTEDLVYPVVLLVLGLILVVRPSIISEIISFVIGIFIMISSFIKLHKVLKNKNSSKYKLGLGLSIAGIVIGLLCILGKLMIPDIVLSFVGLMLLIYSVTDIINIIISESK